MTRHPQTFTTAYYYWVKNKATLPSDVTRFTTAFDVAKLITDPVAQNRRFVAPLGNNRFSLYNCENPIRDKDVGIAFQLVDNRKLQEQNTHNEFQIITMDLKQAFTIQSKQKWIDSLVGFDINDRSVSDIDLPVRERYGNLNEPKTKLVCKQDRS